jgi:sodium-dependent phosphate cotransporter
MVVVLNVMGEPAVKAILFAAAIFLFIFAVDLLGCGFGLMGEDFSTGLISATSNPLLGLIIGLLATSLVQSSSATTAIIVGLVASGTLGVGSAIPMVMGANIGTTITNILVSFSHLKRRHEMKSAVAGAVVHDFFNVIAVAILLPLEIFTGIIEKSAVFLTGVFSGTGVIEVASPLKLVIRPLVDYAEVMLRNDPLLITIAAVALLLLSLKEIVKTARSLVGTKMGSVLDVYLFKNSRTAFAAGLIFTAIIQSSSVTTSLVVPLVGAGLLTVKKIFPYALGANIGTTVTAFIAAAAIGVPAGITIALCHLFFNLFGIIIIYPIRNLPVRMAEMFGEMVSTKRRIAFFYVAFAFYIIPFGLLMLMR